MNVFELMAKLGLDTSDYEKGLKGAGKTGQSFGKTLTKALKPVAAAVGAALGAKAILDFGKSSVKAGMSFDKSMSQVAATMGKTVDEIDDLRDFAQKMGSETAFSATQAADALNYMALAGYDSQTSMKMLPNVLNLAAAGSIDLAYASDMVTDASSALGLSMGETTQMVDKMAKASSMSNTSVAQLGEAFLTVGGTAKDLKGGTTELSAALGILADNGVKGSEGGTALRNIILALEAPTDTAAKKMKQLGLDVYDANGSLRPMEEIFGDLNSRLSTMTQGERTQVLNELFNKVDLKSVNALLGTNAERWDELTTGIDAAQGAAQKMAETQLDNLAGDITLFNSAMEGAKIAISDVVTPALREFVQFGTDSVSKLTQGFKEDGLAGAARAAGEILSGVKDKIVAGFTGAVTKIKEIKWLELGKNIWTTIITGIGDIVTNLKKKFDDATAAIEKIDWFALGEQIWQWIADGVSGIIDAFGDFFADAKKDVENIDWEGLGTSIMNFISAAWDALKSWASGFWEKAKAGIESVDWKAAGEAAKKWIGATWSALKDWAKKLWDKAKAGIQSVNWAEVGGKVKDIISQAWNTLKSWAKSIWGAAKEGIQSVDWASVGNKVLQIFGAAWSQLKTWAAQIWDKAREGILDIKWDAVGKAIWDGIKAGISALVGGLKTIYEGEAALIKGIDWEKLGGDIWDLVKKGVKALVGGIKDLFSDAKDGVTGEGGIDWEGLGSAIVDLIEAGFNAIVGMMTGLFEAAWNDITNIKWDLLGLQILNWVLDGLGPIGDWIRDTFDVARIDVENLDWTGTGSGIEGDVIDGMSGLPGKIGALGDESAAAFGGHALGGGSVSRKGGGGRWTKAGESASDDISDGMSDVPDNIASLAHGGGGRWINYAWQSAGSKAGNSLASGFAESVKRVSETINSLQMQINNLKGKTVTITVNTKGTATALDAVGSLTRAHRNASAMDTGHIFQHPTIFGYADGKYQIAGDVGPEAVVGVSSLNDMIQTSVNRAVGQTQTAILGVLSEILKAMPSGQLVLDTGALVGGIGEEMNAELERIAAWNGGGRA